MAGQGPLPTFLIIGAQKGGTRWLRANLGHHPEIFTVADELWFFNDVAGRFEVRGERWYRRQFADWSGQPVVGEATPGYMMWKHDPPVVAARIQSLIPDVRLVAVLRNPIDRAQSAVVHHIKHGRFPADSRLVDLMRAEPPETEPKNLIAGGWYAASLRPFVERFGNQLLVVLNEDIAADAGDLYQRVVSHVGAAPGFEPMGLGEVKFSNQSADAGRRAVLSQAERLEVYEFFRDDVAQLEVMLGRDLSAWDPSTASSSARAS